MQGLVFLCGMLTAVCSPSGSEARADTPGLTVSDAEVRVADVTWLDTEADDADDTSEKAEENEGVVLPVSSDDPISHEDDTEEFSFQLTDYLQEPAAPAPPRFREQGPPLPAPALPEKLTRSSPPASVRLSPGIIKERGLAAACPDMLKPPPLLFNYD